MDSPEPASRSREGFPATRRLAAVLGFPTTRKLAAVFVCFVLPLGSWIVDGRGALAFTMYSSTIDYRLEMAWLDAAGQRHALSPTAVATNVSFDSAAPFLAGADVFRTVPQIDALRAHLRDVARAGCALAPSGAIEIILCERPSQGGVHRPVTTADHCTTEHVRCPRAE